MDLNGDGKLDILSGSYSRHEQGMAGLFQVLWGSGDGTGTSARATAWQKAAVLNGKDGQPLILPQKSDVTDRICTRPFAVDFDGDGKLDIVSGNFSGTFAWFRGEGGGKFAPQAKWLEGSGGDLRVDAHSDPFLVDWDQDGDLDLLSGSARGGVYLFVNQGKRKTPKYGKRTTLLEPVEHGNNGNGDGVVFGDAHLKAPGADTRVWVDDVDGDGKLDLLVGDQVVLVHVAKGVEEADASKKLAAWQKKREEFFKKPQPQDAEGQKKWREQYDALNKERTLFAPEERTGFVWLIRGKGPAVKG